MTLDVKRTVIYLYILRKLHAVFTNKQKTKSRNKFNCLLTFILLKVDYLSITFIEHSIKLANSKIACLDQQVLGIPPHLKRNIPHL